MKRIKDRLEKQTWERQDRSEPCTCSACIRNCRNKNDTQETLACNFPDLTHFCCDDNDVDETNADGKLVLRRGTSWKEARREAAKHAKQRVEVMLRGLAQELMNLLHKDKTYAKGVHASASSQPYDESHGSALLSSVALREVDGIARDMRRQVEYRFDASKVQDRVGMYRWLILVCKGHVCVRTISRPHQTTMPQP